MVWHKVLRRADEQIARLNNEKDRMSEDSKEEMVDLARRIKTLEKEASIRDEHIRMFEEERDDTAYLFVVYFQPLAPDVKCSPHFVTKSPQGIGNHGIQNQINHTLQVARRRIPHLFLASDGALSCNAPHNEFIDI
jgi:hypothetical protein